MKQKLVIGLALVMLLAVIGYMVFDFFFIPAGDSNNPYDYGLNKLRASDSAKVKYHEVMQISPALSEIHGITVDSDDRIFVAGANGVEVFSPDGTPESAYPFPDTAFCLTVSPGGNLLLGMEDHIEVMDPDGKIISRWKPASDESVLTSLAADGSGVFVADAGMRSVYHYDPDGRLLNLIGEEDSLKGILKLIIPSPYFDVGIGRDDEVWVVNPGRHIFEAFRPDGTLISTWGVSSMEVEGFCGCCNPSNFAILQDGSFVTSEKGIERVKIYDPTGTFQCLVAGPDQFDEGTRGLDLAVDSEGRILVLDPWRNKVRVFVRNKVNEKHP